MKCLRCFKELKSPDSTNADYVIAKDFRSKEKRTQFYAVTNNNEEIKVSKVEDTLGLENIKEVKGRIEEINIQKTGIVCTECFNPDTDFVIWGIHKGQGVTKKQSLSLD
jgi:hypothetical protein